MSAARGTRPESARALAVRALVRIDDEGAYANLVLPAMLGRSSLDDRDRHLVTELVYGTTRRRRSLDHLIDPFLRHRPNAATMAALRLGTYQLLLTKVPTYAAVSSTVAVAPGRTRALVNAVLRKVAKVVEDEVVWPSPAVELSYPDWIVELLTADIGAESALDALRTMSLAPTVSVRSDGYHQDRASQLVVEEIGAAPDSLVIDVCAGPGGKSTGFATGGARVVAADRSAKRAALVRANAARLGSSELISVVAADGSAAPWRRECADVVLVDAACSGLGVLHRRADARWRIQPDDVERLARLQIDLLRASAPAVRPGGLLVYSVCTLTNAETVDVDEVASRDLADFDAQPLDGARWRPHGRGGLLLPQDEATDGMFLLMLRKAMR